MNVALRKPRMTREQFLDWVQTQERRWEFDGFNVVGMVGGTMSHAQISANILLALGRRLRGGPCRPLGSDAAVATIGDAVRYPDALVTCTKGPGTDLLTPGVIIVFEVLSPSSGHNDSVVKLREYRAVASIRRYVVVESAGLGLTVFARGDGGGDFTATALISGDTLQMPEIGAEIPVDEFYEDVELPPPPALPPQPT